MSLWPRPSAAVVLIVTSLWLIGTTLSFLAMTNGFTQTPFELQNTVLLGIQAGAFATWVAVVTAWLRGSSVKT